MSLLHPHWDTSGHSEESGSEPVVADVQKVQEVQSVSRKPAAILGILIVTGLGFTFFQGLDSLRGQLSDPTITIKIAEAGLDPADITVSPGDIIAWENEQGIPHVLQSDTLCEGTDCLRTDTVFPGSTSRYTVPRGIAAGTYSYNSLTTVSMQGKITVVGSAPVAPTTELDTSAPPADSPFGDIFSLFGEIENSAGGGGLESLFQADPSPSTPPANDPFASSNPFGLGSDPVPASNPVPSVQNDPFVASSDPVPSPFADPVPNPSPFPATSNDPAPSPFAEVTKDPFASPVPNPSPSPFPVTSNDPFMGYEPSPSPTPSPSPSPFPAAAGAGSLGSSDLDPIPSPFPSNDPLGSTDPFVATTPDPVPSPALDPFAIHNDPFTQTDPFASDPAPLDPFAHSFGEPAPVFEPTPVHSPTAAVDPFAASDPFAAALNEPSPVFESAERPMHRAAPQKEILPPGVVALPTNPNTVQNQVRRVSTPSPLHSGAPRSPRPVSQPQTGGEVWVVMVLSMGVMWWMTRKKQLAVSS